MGLGPNPKKQQMVVVNDNEDDENDSGNLKMYGGDGIEV